MSNSNAIEEVKGFWNTEACGSHFISDFRDERDFFDKYQRFRYQTEWHIPLLVPFADTKGKEVLEIGCGNGADGAMFAKNGAVYTGVDLTETAVRAASRHFEIEGLDGRFQVEDAECLSFADESFDMVYSYGVLHHTPDPARAIGEVFRVLKPGGQAIVMLYHRRSFNYYVRILGYMRLRLLLKIMSRAGRLKSDREKAEKKELKGLRGNTDPNIWSVHYDNYLLEGWSYLRANNFAHHATDGPECPFAYVFSKKEARRLFSSFSEVRMKVAHFPLRKYSVGKLIPFGIEKFLASTLGWNLMVFAKK
jgi:ubiquinone/menaquinone biosynthesis C-methylase UbiE